MIRSIFILFMFIYFPFLSMGQNSESNNTRWEANVGFGAWANTLIKDNFTGSDGGWSYQLDMFHYYDDWTLSPIIRLMPEWSLMGEHGTSHYEIGVRGGRTMYRKKSQFSFLLGASYMFGEAYGSKVIGEEPNYSGTGMRDKLVYLHEEYQAVSVTSELSWKRVVKERFVVGIALPVSVNSWYVSFAPHYVIGYK